MTANRAFISSAGLLEWRRAWPVPLASMIGNAAGILYFTTMGFFLKPVQADTGWTLSQITLVVPIVAFIGAVIGPLAGLLIDRVSARYVAIAGLVATLLLLAAIGVFPHTLIGWWTIWAVLGIFAVFAKATVWAKSVTTVFDASRGLALAVMGSGLGLFALITPSLTMWLIDAYGWRMAYVYLAGIAMITTVPLVCLAFGTARYFRVPSEPGDEVANGTARPVKAHTGLTTKAAVRGRHFWQLVGAGFLVGAGLSSITLHFPDMMAEKGLNHPQIALVMGALGMSTLIGRVVTGGLLDMLSGSMIGALAFLAPTLSCALYLMGPVDLPRGIIIAGLFGLASGAESDVIGYLTSRYIGLRSFGFSFGCVMAGLGVGAGIGPQLTSMLHDRYGSYSLSTVMLGGCLVLGALVIGTLGKVPKFEPLSEEAELAAAAIALSGP